MTMYPQSPQQAQWASDLFHALTTIITGFLVHPVIGTVAAWGWASWYLWNTYLGAYFYPEQNLTIEQQTDAALRRMFDGNFDGLKKQIATLEKQVAELKRK